MRRENKWVSIRINANLAKWFLIPKDNKVVGIYEVNTKKGRQIRCLSFPEQSSAFSGKNVSSKINSTFFDQISWMININ